MGDDDAPRVARYQLRRRLGMGGLGVVYAAFDPELGREIAVKLIRIGATDHAGLDRLEQEAMALARVSHPNVVEVFDVGRYDLRFDDQWPHDVPRRGVYVVMELVHGEDLRTWLRATRTTAEIVHVLTRAGRGLAAAHAAGIVHRDFKPANVIVDEQVDAKVLDFGLAQRLSTDVPSTRDDETSEEPASHAADSACVPASSMTRTGTVMGTPAYMAPEQHRGERADAKSDQYAFCVALAEALCGERPFSGTTVADLHRAKTQLRLSPRLRGVPARLRAVIERGLSLDPAARWGSMDELLDRLSDRRSSRLPWIGAGLLGASGIAGWLIQPPSPPPPPLPDEPELVAIDGLVPSAEAMELRALAEEAWVDDEPDAVVRVLERFAPDGETPDEPTLAAEVLLWRGRLAPDEEAVELYRRAFFLAREADAPSIAARAANAAANVVLGDHGQALAEWTRHAWVELHRGPWDRGAAVQVLVTSGYGRAVAFGDEQAAEILELASAAVGDIEPEDGPFMAFQMAQLAAAWRFAQQPERGAFWARRAAVLIDATAEPGHPVRASAEEEIGLDIIAQWPCYEGLPHLERARASYQASAAGGTDLEGAIAGFHIAECLEELGRYEAALAEYRSMIDFWAALDDEYGMREIDARISIARLLARMGRRAEAEREYEQAIEVVNPVGPDHPLRNLARQELEALRKRSP
ncbi:MAG: serine/threonine protein kinase [Myxococcales bacterium]|nr:serine/threonine protein kinase [Myxococcales bacterium]MCB9715286.1 serine/threonine protein kinase [Myxococcales bacterium]